MFEQLNQQAAAYSARLDRLKADFDRAYAAAVRRLGVGS